MELADAHLGAPLFDAGVLRAADVEVIGHVLLPEFLPLADGAQAL